MPIIVKAKESAPPVPQGTYQAVCYAIIDLGEQPSNNPQWAPSQQVLFMFELPEERIEFERDGRKMNLPRTMSRTFPARLGSGNKPTKLRTFLETWRGRKFTDEELKGWDVKNVLGANGLLTVIHTEKNGRVYANVDAVAPLVKGMERKRAELDLTYFTLSDIPEAMPLVWPESVPEWIRKKIIASAEYVARFGGGEAAAQQELADDDPIPF